MKPRNIDVDIQDAFHEIQRNIYVYQDYDLMACDQITSLDKGVLIHFKI